MKIIVSHKLFGLICSIPLPCKQMRADLETAKKNNLINVENTIEGANIYINEDFIFDIMSAIVSTLVPIVGLLGSGVYLIDQLSSRFDEIGKKYVPEKKEYATNNIADPNFKVNNEDEEDDW